MSIIQRYSPVNLSYKVVIVTNASSPVGIVVCKTLLKANALVLGTDSNRKDDSLEASAYSHFQFHQGVMTDDGTVEAVVAHAEDKFKTMRVDALVNLGRNEDSAETRAAHRRLIDACVQAMEAGNGGSIVNCTVEAVGLEPSHVIEEISSGAVSSKVRSSTIADKTENLQPCYQFAEAQDHFQFLFKPAGHRVHKEASAETRAMFEFSNVVLFLVSELSQDLDGIILDRQGRLLRA